MIHDLHAAVRSLLRRPLYPLVAAGILTLGLSASIAVVTYVNGFYQPFPGSGATRLVRLFEVDTEEPYQEIPYLDFLDYAGSAEAGLDAETGGAFAGLAAVQPYYAASVRLETKTEVAFLEAVSGKFFSLLGVATPVGRGLSAGDDRAGAEPAAVLSHRWWQRSFGELGAAAESSVVGRTIYLNYRPFTVVGVASPAFLGSASDFRPDVWIPITAFKDRYTGWAARSEDREVPLVRVYGRLGPGVGEEQGLAALERVAAGLDEVYPRKAPRRLALDAATWIDPRSRREEWPTVRLMLAAAIGLLLLVCANVANLLLSVAVRRRQEIAVRSALGASPGRLARQVLIENLLLAGLAGVVALPLAGPAAARLGAYFARPSVWGANVARQAAVDLRVVAFALVAAVLTGVAAGLLPALRARRRNLVATLWTDAGGGASGPSRLWGRRRPGVRDLLVAVQVALSVVLLVVAGLVLRTLQTVGDLDPGFATERLLVTHISTSSTDLEVGNRDRFFRRLAEELAAAPWVRSATVADFPLLSPHASTEMRLDGRNDPASLVYSRVIPGFFDALGIEVRRGRGFVDADAAGSPDVAIVNEELARRFFAGEDPVGRRLWWSAGEEAERMFEIVGLVGDTRTEDLLAPPPPTVYFSYPQHRYPSGSALLVATAGDPRAAVPQLYRWLRDFEPHLAIVNVLPYTDVVRGFLYTQRMNAELFSLLAFVALMLSAVGIWSVVSLAVSRRKREIGIRLAIGAGRGDIRRLILGRALAAVALGLAVGLAVALALTGLVRGLLYGVSPTDPVALAAGAGVLVAAAFAAAYLPARRAATVDPTTALRHE